MFTNNLNCRSRQFSQIARAQLFLSQLDIIHTPARRLRNLVQQLALPRRFVIRQLAAVGNVVKQAALWHVRSAYHQSAGVRSG